eukprot:5282040-Prymnesium_polylepis.1
MIKWIFVISITIHWFACALGLLAQMQGSLRDKEDGLEGAIFARMQNDSRCYGCVSSVEELDRLYCGDLTPCLTSCEFEELAYINVGSRSPAPSQLRHEEARLYKSEHWICRAAAVGVDLAPANHGQVWVAALYVAMLQVGGGVGTIVPENSAEYLLWFGFLLLGSVLWAIFTGTICGLIATGDPHDTNFRQTMDHLNYFLADMRIPQHVCIKTREFLKQTRDLGKHQSYFKLVELLSPDIRSEVVYMMSGTTLSTVWYLAACDSPFLIDLAFKIRRACYAPREKISAIKLNILMRGVAAKAGNILTE